VAKRSSQGKTNTSGGSISRRTFLVAATAALPATEILLFPLGGVAAAGGAGASGVLTPELSEVCNIVLDRLIPAHRSLPAAGALGITRFVDDVMRDAPHLRLPILDILHQVHLAVKRAAECISNTELDALLARLEGERKPAFDVLLQVTYTGYYGHPAVHREIGWSAPQASEVREAFDISLLDDVRQMSPVYTTV
jgi:hypothetical protein